MSNGYTITSTRMHAATVIDVMVVTLLSLFCFCLGRPADQYDQYDCGDFLNKQRSTVLQEQQISDKAGPTRFIWDYLLREEARSRHKLIAAEFSNCRNVLEVGAHPVVNIHQYLTGGARLESVTIVSPIIPAACAYKPIGARPRVLYRQAPQLLEDLADPVNFDCVALLGVECHTPEYRQAMQKYVTAADVAVIGAAVRFEQSMGCGTSTVEHAIASGMQVKFAMELHLTSADVAEHHRLQYGRRNMWVLRRPSFVTCELGNISYVPSVLETKWHDLVHSASVKTKSEYCSQLAHFKGQFDTWLAYTQQTAVGVLNTSSPVPGGDDLFSKHRYSYHCGAETFEYVAYLEPLAGHLRNPYGFCDPDDTYFLRYDFMLPASVHQPPRKTGRAFYFDIGARTYDVGVGVYPNGTNLPAQRFIVDTYRQNGITFDRMLLWDPATSSRDVFKAVPADLLPYYQYFGTSASTGNDANNPFVTLKQLCVPSDFVVVKLDVDVPQLEKAWLQQLAQDIELMQMIDEFYFEFNPNEAGWGALAEAYDVLTTLRNAGVRAHGWI